MVNPNNIKGYANLETDQKQMVLGLLISVDGENRLYFSNSSIGNQITSSNDKISMGARNYMTSTCLNTIELKTILLAAGVDVVDEKPEYEHLDLSPESLNKTTILNLFK